MNLSQALSVIDRAMFAQFERRLSDVETVIIKGSWQNQTYEQIAETSDYSASYLRRDVGPKLWKLLSHALEEPVSKKNFHKVLERRWRQEVGQNKGRGTFEQKRDGNRDRLSASSVPISQRSDWGEVVDVSFFYGRSTELSTLAQWILVEHSRSIAILGMGGVGKTALAAKIAQQIQGDFAAVIWRSLRNAPPLETLLEELVPFLSEQQDLQAEIGRLLYWLRADRCLLILDNVETILQSRDYAGQYRPGYENYGELVRLVGETVHQSCLLLTSREKPAEIAMLEGGGRSSPVRSLQLGGSPEAARALIQAKGLSGSQEQQQQLCQLYSCNPLALKIVATSIQDLFGGEIGEFLAEDTTLFHNVRRLLEQQFNRLSPLEQSIMYWLAINREWTTISELAEDIVPTVLRSDLLEALESLRWRSLIEKRAGSYTQQPVVMEYVTERLTEQVTRELAQVSSPLLPCPTAPLPLFHRYALLKTTVKDYVRESQVRLILQPIANQLRTAFGSPQAIEQRFWGLLGLLRASETAGYGGGNLINLAQYIPIDLTGYDFSHLTIWQANLQGITAHNVNFAHSELARSVFTQPFGTVQSVALSPDGNLLAAGDSTGQIRLWRVANGQPRLICKGHTNWVCAVAFSPSGRILASGSFDQTIKLWDVGTGECLNTLQEHTNEVWSVTFSPDGQQLASGSFDQTVRLWDVHNGQCLNTLSGHIKGVRSVAFSPDGQTIASGGADQTAKLWDVSSGQCLNTLKGHRGWIRSVTFSPDSRMLASGGDDRTLKLWDVRTGQRLNTLQGHTHTVWSVAFRPDGRVLASSSDDRTVRLWDVGAGRPLNTLLGHTNSVWSIAFSPDGRVLASGSFDQTVRLWDVDTGQCLNTLQGYANKVWSIAFAPQGEGDSKAMSVGEIVSKELGHYNPTSRTLASASDDQIVRLWDVDTGQRHKLRGHTDLVMSVSFSPNSQLLASGSGDEERAVRLWNVGNGECLNTLLGHTNRIFSVAFSPNGQLLASSSADQTVKIWRVSDGKCLKTLQDHHTNWVWSVTFSPNGQLLATGSLDRTLRLWSVDTGECLNTLQGHTSGVFSVVFSPDGQLLVSSSGDHTVRLWNVDTGQCLTTLKGHTNSVGAVRFSPNGQQLASGSFDGTVRLWDVRTGRCLKTLKGHTNGIWSVSFSADGQLLASGSDDESIRVWDVKSGECLTTLRADCSYEGMNITGVRGLTEAQKTTLKALGAVEESS